MVELAFLGEMLEKVERMGGFAPGQHHGDKLLAGEVSWKFGLDEDDYFFHAFGFLIRNLTCWRLCPSLRKLT